LSRLTSSWYRLVSLGLTLSITFEYSNVVECWNLSLWINTSVIFLYSSNCRRRSS
jgi:hypothetical protein